MPTSGVAGSHLRSPALHEEEEEVAVLHPDPLREILATHDADAPALRLPPLDEVDVREASYPPRLTPPPIASPTEEDKDDGALAPRPFVGSARSPSASRAIPAPTRRPGPGASPFVRTSSIVPTHSVRPVPRPSPAVEDGQHCVACHHPRPRGGGWCGICGASDETSSSTQSLHLSSSASSSSPGCSCSATQWCRRVWGTTASHTPSSVLLLLLGLLLALFGFLPWSVNPAQIVFILVSALTAVVGGLLYAWSTRLVEQARLRRLLRDLQRPWGPVAASPTPLPTSGGPTPAAPPLRRWEVPATLSAAPRVVLHTLPQPTPFRLTNEEHLDWEAASWYVRHATLLRTWVVVVCLLLWGVLLLVSPEVVGAWTRSFSSSSSSPTSATVMKRPDEWAGGGIVDNDADAAHRFGVAIYPSSVVWSVCLLHVWCVVGLRISYVADLVVGLIHFAILLAQEDHVSASSIFVAALWLLLPVVGLMYRIGTDMVFEDLTAAAEEDAIKQKGKTSAGRRDRDDDARRDGGGGVGQRLAMESWQRLLLSTPSPRQGPASAQAPLITNESCGEVPQTFFGFLQNPCYLLLNRLLIVVDVGPALCELMGLPAAYVRGRRLGELLSYLQVEEAPDILALVEKLGMGRAADGSVAAPHAVMRRRRLRWGRWRRAALDEGRPVVNGAAPLTSATAAVEVGQGGAKSAAAQVRRVVLRGRVPSLTTSPTAADGVARSFAVSLDVWHQPLRRHNDVSTGLILCRRPRLHQLCDELPLPVALVHPHTGRLLFWSRRAAAMTGFNSAAMLRFPLYAHIIPQQAMVSEEVVADGVEDASLTGEGAGMNPSHVWSGMGGWSPSEGSATAPFGGASGDVAAISASGSHLCMRGVLELSSGEAFACALRPLRGPLAVGEANSLGESSPTRNRLQRDAASLAAAEEAEASWAELHQRVQDLDGFASTEEAQRSAAALLVMDQLRGERAPLVMLLEHGIAPTPPCPPAPSMNVARLQYLTQLGHLVQVYRRAQMGADNSRTNTISSIGVPAYRSPTTSTTPRLPLLQNFEAEVLACAARYEEMMGQQDHPSRDYAASSNPLPRGAGGARGQQVSGRRRASSAPRLRLSPSLVAVEAQPQQLITPDESISPRRHANTPESGAKQSPQRSLHSPRMPPPPSPHTHDDEEVREAEDGARSSWPLHPISPSPEADVDDAHLDEHTPARSRQDDGPAAATAGVAASEAKHRGTGGAASNKMKRKSAGKLWAVLLSRDKATLPSFRIRVPLGVPFHFGRSSKCEGVVSDTFVSSIQFAITRTLAPEEEEEVPDEEDSLPALSERGGESGRGSRGRRGRQDSRDTSVGRLSRRHDHTTAPQPRRYLYELLDHSANGTYVNVKKIGKGKSSPLPVNALITFRLSSTQFFMGFVFVLVDERGVPLRHAQRELAGSPMDSFGSFRRGTPHRHSTPDGGPNGNLSFGSTTHSPNHNGRRRRNGSSFSAAPRGPSRGAGNNSTPPRRETIEWKIGEEMLGRGGNAEVFLGINLTNGQLIAVKRVLLPAAINCGGGEGEGANTSGSMAPEQEKEVLQQYRSLQEEISVLSKAVHPNIVQYYGSSQNSTYFNILLEFVPGGSLRHLLDNFGALSPGVITSYLRQAMEGLAYLHHSDIVHSDIKTANILVTEKGEVKLTDFGTSRLLNKQHAMAVAMERTGPAAAAAAAASSQASPSEGAAPTSSKPDHHDSTTTVHVAGTLRWMDPMLLRGATSGGSNGPTKAGDVWSVGCTMIEMMSGEAPWYEYDFESEEQIINLLRYTEGPPEVPECPECPELVDIATRCLQLNPAARPTCDELLDLLRQLEAKQAAQASPRAGG